MIWIALIFGVVFVVSMIVFIRSSNSNRSSRTSNNVKKEMLDSISSFMSKYAAQQQGEIDNVVYIFARAIQMTNSLSEKELVKAMRSNGVTPEGAALNTLQNCAMAEIKQVSGTDFILGRDDGAYKLYNAINDEKLIKGHISLSQYEENKLLGTKLHLTPPGGYWL